MANLVLFCTLSRISQRITPLADQFFFFVETPWDLKLILFGENRTINHASLESPIERRDWHAINITVVFYGDIGIYEMYDFFLKNIKNNTLRAHAE